MKRIIVFILTAIMLFSITVSVYAVGDGNVDNGGGGMDREHQRISGYPARRASG